MTPTDEPGRKARILEAAERAFGEFGFDGASLRGIVRDAGVNLATVYYYFGSKEGLMKAVFNRRFDPLRQEHLGLLRQLEGGTRRKAATAEKIIEAMVLPPLRLAAEEGGKPPVVMRLIGRIVTEPNPRTQDLLRSEYADVRQAFLAVWQRCLPDAPVPDLRWRIEFVWGALAFILTNPRKIEKESEGRCNPRDTPSVVAQMTAFFAAGFRAPAVTAPDPKAGRTT